jgi:hypothetical protein
LFKGVKVKVLSSAIAKQKMLEYYGLSSIVDSVSVDGITHIYIYIGNTVSVSNNLIISLFTVI